MPFWEEMLPFGLKVSPNSFQRMMTVAMAGLSAESTFLYLDGIVVVGCSESHHLKNLVSVFNRLRRYNLKLNPEKCNFFQKEVTYLGHLITANGIPPDSAKYDKIRDYPVPGKANEVRRFVALCNYYRRFIPYFADTASCLNNLLRKRIKFIWSDKCQNSFQKLKNSLLSPQILQYPYFEKKFILVTDASDVACGAVLTQPHDDIDHPVAYASKGFTKGERNKSTIEKELTAIHWAVNRFLPYLYGRKFSIKTNHRPLGYLFSMKNPSSKLTRMRLDLEEFDFDIDYIKGKENVGADALSRINVSTDSLKTIAILQVQTRSAAKTISSNSTTAKVVNNEIDHLRIHESLSVGILSKKWRLQFVQIYRGFIIHLVRNKKRQLL